MARRSVVEYTTGTPGCGKTLVRCAQFLVSDWLPNHRGVHWSNFPIGPVPEGFQPVPPRREGEEFRDRIAATAAKRARSQRLRFLWHPRYWGAVQTADVMRERMQLIPREVLDSWMVEESGPWDFFHGKDLSGCHVAIDEIHNFCGKRHKPAHRAKWAQWLGEIRHLGATVEFITQDEDKVADEIPQHAAIRRRLVAAEYQRDPLFKIPMSDWYEIFASWTGEYIPAVWEIEERKTGKSFKRNATRKFRLDPQWFQYYNSFSAPEKGGKAGRSELKEYQKRSKIGLIWWFIASHPLPLLTRGAILAFFIWIGAFGGGGAIINYMVRGFSGATASAATVKTDKPEDGTGRRESRRPVTSGPTVDIDGQPVRVPPEVEVVLRERQAELERVRVEAERVRRELATAEAELRRGSTIAAITAESVTLRSGYSYRVGETIDWGEYEGSTVESIDYRRRLCVLDDGRVLRLGVDRLRSIDRKREPAGVPSDVRGAESRGGPDHARREPRPSPDSVE